MAVLGLAGSAFGGLVLPRLADADVPATLRPPAAKPPVAQQLTDGRCPDREAPGPRGGGAPGT